jgi:hypothetical protein
MKIKPTQIYGWDSEPVDERPSEFMSTGYSHLSGFYPQTEAPPRRTKPSLFGFKSLVLAALAVIGLGAYAIDKLLPLLHA